MSCLCRMSILLLLTAGFGTAQTNAVDYLKDVKPLLNERCGSCHGAIRQRSQLRLDTATLLKMGGENGPVIMPGMPDQSSLIARVTATDDDERMPPASEGVALDAEQIEILRAWIAEGAVAPDEPAPEDPRSHWAWQPPVKSDLPVPGLHPIDSFLEAARRDRGLATVNAASDDTWLRRVTIDLTGVPPTPEQMRAFRQDQATDRFESVVDRLLASPQHGERWARHWMDVWRYSDWYGLGEELRFSHYHIWRWRDWIIESLNSDLGYDQMIVAMLAGDEAAPQDPSTVRATGFLVRNWDIFNRNKWLDNTIQHTSRAFLGITMQCAKCHDHKFDPISQEDYYRLRAIFEPYQVRIDRVPGQSDRNKDGLARVFDDFLDTPTYLFVRGDENQPDKDQSLNPAVPAVFGSELLVQPVSLPRESYAPDKRDFVIEEYRTAALTATAAARQRTEAARSRLTAAEAARTAAMNELTTAQGVFAAADKAALGAARTEAASRAKQLSQATIAVTDTVAAVQLAESQLKTAFDNQAAADAVLHAETLEDTGARDAGTAEWISAAQGALTAQRAHAVSLAQASELEAQQTVDTASRSLDGSVAALDAAQSAVTAKPDDESLKAQIEALQKAVHRASTALVDARKKLDDAARARSAAEVAASQPLTTEYSPRPQEYQRAKITYRDTPSTAPYAKTSTGRRLAFAQWLTDRRNPLTARVAVNQIWMRHFGVPLVENVYDFGLRSRRPLHHGLLDWLAVEFIESGWSMKHIHRLILTSAAFRMDSAATDLSMHAQQQDPDNLYFWRMNVRRMEAEVIRDSLLQLSGRLDPAMFGPDIPLPAADDGLRRSIYYRYSRDHRMKFLTMFDAASAEECYRRSETIVPQQALALSNSQLVLTRADEISGRLTVGSPDAENAAFVAAAFEMILNRPASAEEHSASVEWLTGLSCPREQARSAFVHVLINHNDFVTIR